MYNVHYVRGPYWGTGYMYMYMYIHVYNMCISFFMSGHIPQGSWRLNLRNTDKAQQAEENTFAFGNWKWKCWVSVVNLCAYICDSVLYPYLNTSILNALQERRKEREKQAAAKKELFQQQRESVEKRAWKDFWDSESRGLLLYACLHGTVEIVKYFITKLVSPTTRYMYIHVYYHCAKCKICHTLKATCTCTCIHACSYWLVLNLGVTHTVHMYECEIMTVTTHVLQVCVLSPCFDMTRNKHHTPLSCAAKAGKHDIVAYLLTIKGVTAEGTAPNEVHTMYTHTHTRTHACTHAHTHTHTTQHTLTHSTRSHM